MENEQYIEALENLLIFMCRNYDETQKNLMRLYIQDDNNAFDKTIHTPSMSELIGFSKLADASYEGKQLSLIEAALIVEKKRAAIKEATSSQAE